MTKKTSTTLQITKLIAPLFKYTTGILNLLNTTTYRHCRFTLNSVHLKSTRLVLHQIFCSIGLFLQSYTSFVSIHISQTKLHYCRTYYSHLDGKFFVGAIMTICSYVTKCSLAKQFTCAFIPIYKNNTLSL